MFLLEVARLTPSFRRFRDAVLLSSDTGLLMKPVLILPLSIACVLFPLALLAVWFLCVRLRDAGMERSHAQDFTGVPWHVPRTLSPGAGSC